MNPFELSQVADLGAEVAKLLQHELGSHGHVHAIASRVVISINKFEGEFKLGNMLQHIYRTVDQHFPVRKEHISLVVKEMEGGAENVFKIWKSTT